MQKSKILLLEQETRSVDSFNKIEEIVNFKKENKKTVIKILLSGLFLSCFIGTGLYYDNLGLLNFITIALYMFFTIFVITKYSFNKNYIDKKELDKIFIKKYEVASLNNSIKNINIKEINDIKNYIESIFLHIDINNIEFAILFFTERYMYEEDKTRIEKNINFLNKRIEENEKFIVNKKRMLQELYKKVPYIDSIIDVKNLDLTEKEIEIEKNELQEEKLKNEKLKEEIKLLKTRLKECNIYNCGGFVGF